MTAASWELREKAVYSTKKALDRTKSPKKSILVIKNDRFRWKAYLKTAQ